MKSNIVVSSGRGPEFGGGGIYSKESMMEIDGNVFTGNHARIGSALFATLGAVRFTRNLAETNSMYNSYPLPACFGSLEGAVKHARRPRRQNR